MSRIYFDSPSGGVELLGRERAYMGLVVSDLAVAHLRPDGFGFRQKVEPMLPGGHYLHTTEGPRWVQTFSTWWSVSYGEHLTVGDEKVSPFDLSLNTALVAGSDAIELLARIHATCEIHGYIEGPDREWIAGIVDQGRKDNVLRPDMGWEILSEFLTSDDSEPVVMSYSVTDGFPDARNVLPGYDEENEDDFYAIWEAMGHDAQWEKAMAWLRERNETHPVSISPDIWGDRGFGNGWSVFDFLVRLHEED